MANRQPAWAFSYTVFHASFSVAKGMASSISGVSIPHRMAPSTPMALPWRMLLRISCSVTSSFSWKGWYFQLYCGPEVHRDNM